MLGFINSYELWSIYCDRHIQSTLNSLPFYSSQQTMNRCNYFVLQIDMEVQITLIKLFIFKQLVICRPKIQAQSYSKSITLKNSRNNNQKKNKGMIKMHDTIASLSLFLSVSFYVSFYHKYIYIWASLVAQMIKNLSEMQET